jgi:glycosyltransferase involved in cell wall biosynthesis
VGRLAPWLVSRGHQVTVYGRGNRRSWTREVDGVHVVDTRGLNTKSASTASHGVTAALHCLRHKPDVVLGLNVANGPAVLLLRARSVPVVMNVDGVEWKRAKWGRLAKAGFRVGAVLSARFAQTLVADSIEIGRIWEEEYDVEPVFIPYGGDVLDDILPGRVRELGLVPGTYALAVARLAPENNVELFLDAMESEGWATPTVVVGSANYRNPIEARLERLSADGRVLWLGHVDEPDLLAALWAHAGVYFHGHSVGGTNPALLSALGCGAPTLAVDTPFNREVLEADEQLLPPDPGVVAEAIRTLLDDQDARARFGARGQRIIRDRYSWDSVLAEYESTLIAASLHPRSWRRRRPSPNADITT